MKLTRRGRIVVEGLVYVASFLFGVFSVPLGIWWT